MKQRNIYYDIIVIGGGIIGSSFALRMSQYSFKVMLIERKKPKFWTFESDTPDLRVFAINYNSINFLTAINVWQCIDINYCTSYCQLETWEYHAFKVIFDSKSINLTEMGYIIEHNRLQTAIWRMFRYATLTLACPVSIISIKYNGSYWQLLLNNGRLVIGRLLVGADGIYSSVRKSLGIAISGWRYNQVCLLLSAKVEKIQPNTVWQIFTPSGPRGCLPLYDNWVSLMWYDKIERIYQLRKLPLLMLEKEIEIAFMHKLGNIKLCNLDYVYLLCQHAHNYIRPGLALIGDAAHCIHPLAGQGVNLGFRDAEILAKILINARSKNDNWDNIEVLKSYQQNRKYDNWLMQFGIHVFYLMFNNDNLALKTIRNCGFFLINRSSFFKQQILRYALGIFN